jgi:hypothetical protein
LWLDSRVLQQPAEARTMKIQRKSLTRTQFIGTLRTVATFFGSWLLPVILLLVLFSTVALLTRGHYPVVQRIYTYF